MVSQILNDHAAFYNPPDKGFWHLSDAISLGLLLASEFKNGSGKFLSMAPSAQSRKTNLGVLFWRVSGIDIPFPIMSIVAP